MEISLRIKLTTSIINQNRSCLKIYSEVKSKKRILVWDNTMKQFTTGVQSSTSFTTRKIQSSNSNEKLSLCRKISNKVIVKKQVSIWAKNQVERKF